MYNKDVAFANNMVIEIHNELPKAGVYEIINVSVHLVTPEMIDIPKWLWFWHRQY
tara:strand:- start:409 stop:573 length:165 start_codon:yes stop_codon:yes gene_type:complete